MADGLLSLEERILVFFGEEPFFTVKDVQNKFPDEHERTVYRAVNKLIETSQIRFLKWQGGKKIYTTAGVSSLPMYKSTDGDVLPIGGLLNRIPDWYDENSHLMPVEKLHRLFVDMMFLFVIAQEEDDKELKRQFIAVHKRLLDHKQMLLRILENIDNVLNHQTMQGDIQKFRAAFLDKKDPAVPSAEELLKFRSWVAKQKFPN